MHACLVHADGGRTEYRGTRQFAYIANLYLSVNHMTAPETVTDMFRVGNESRPRRDSDWMRIALELICPTENPVRPGRAGLLRACDDDMTNSLVLFCYETRLIHCACNGLCRHSRGV
jgi:hypothetical protein